MPNSRSDSADCCGWRQRNTLTTCVSDDGRQAGGRGLQVERVGRAEHLAVVPAAARRTKKNAAIAASGLAAARGTDRRARAGRQVSSRSPRAARRPVHERRVRPLGAQGQRRQHVGAEVHGQDLDDRERQRDPEQHEGQVGHQLRHVRGQDVGQELADVLEDRAALLDRRRRCWRSCRPAGPCRPLPGPRRCR